MSQITIRHIDPKLENLIRRISKQQHKSLSDVANQLLLKGAGLEGVVAKNRNLKDLAGTWSQEEAEVFDKNQEQFSQVDPELWK